jgi:cell wall-associated NlpC family hydrolase
MKAAHYPCSPALAPSARGWCVVLLAVALAGCGGGERVRPDAPKAPLVSSARWDTVPPRDPASANAVLMRAISLVGTPYRYGGNSPEGGFDCSGLIQYVFRDTLGLSLPRTSRDLAAMKGPKIAPERLTTADLVFFGKGGTVTHVGIYVGEGRFVHAPSTGGTVRLDRLDGPYWRDHYSGAKRVIE